MSVNTIARKNADMYRKTIGKTVYVVKSVYSGKECINSKISKLIMRRAELISN